MSLNYTKDVSTSLAIFYLKITGFWVAATRKQQWIRNVTVIYTVFMVLHCMWIQLMGIYFCWGNFIICIDYAINTAGMIMDLFKLLFVSIKKKEFLRLIVYMQQNFWHSNYDHYERLILDNVKRMSIYFVCVFSFFSQTTIFCYIIRPLIANIGRNETDRIFIFSMWFDLPLTVTPYYEIIYVIQTLSLYHSGVCFLCFDNIFCIMCLHVSGQFRILQYRMRNVCQIMNKQNNQNEKTSNVNLLYSSEEYFMMFRNCIQQHQALMEFCAKLEEVFKVITLGQVLTFSVLICFIGYQVLLADLNLLTRFSLICFIMTNMCQLWMFTYSCDMVTRESASVSLAAYSAPWTQIPMDDFGKRLRKNVQFVITRSRQPCSLTACGFFPVSLETYTSIISTSMSYFTLLNRRTVDTTDT